MTYNLILRKGISFLLILALIFSGFFVTPNQATAETQTITTIKTKEFDDLAYYDVWKHQDGTWQKGIKPGSSVSQTYTITESQVPDGAKIISVKGEFNYGYRDKYLAFAVPTGSVSGVSYEIPNGQVKNGKYADLTYTVSTTLIANVGPYVLNEVWQAANVEGYRYYIPAHFEITYEITETVEIPEPPAPEEITAVIEAPASAKTGESFSVADGTLVGEETVLARSTLYKSVDGGTKQLVAEWEGTGNKGENTGGSISETYDTPCKIEYELIAETESGLTDTATKTVTINDGREISGQADLELDKYTYEGHPADAKDYSEFTVDGESYSAKRAYEEGIARNSYRVQGGTAKKDGYDAIVTFPNKGIYPVTLNVTVKSTGERLADTENIEVRKTPYVEGGLGGFQKQNRKQTLDFHIATYPDKPITDWHITIKDEKSGETAIIDSENPKFVGNSIKTREAQVIIEDKYWTTIRIEFLTKYPDYDQTGESTRKFYYGIKVTDSKGDSDTESDYFDVAPDLPPVPQIGIQTTFLRNQGTNIAALEAEDISSSDGDQLQRSWHVADHNPLTGAMGAYAQAEAKDGYENLAFGTNQKIGWNKEGVGKETVKLHVKDVWIEPTLEEYITADDYLEAETTAQTEVINIAPVVSIEPLETLKANIAVMVKANQFQMLQNQLNSLQASLIQNGIDGNVSLVKVADGTKEGQVTIDVDNTAGGGANNYDSERMYLFHGDSNNSFKIDAYNNDTGKSIWSYTTGTNNISSIYVDRNKEKYVIANQVLDGTKSTIIFESNTGAYLTRVQGVHLDGEVFLSNDEKRLYCVNDTGIYRLDIKTGNYKCLLADSTIRKPRMNNGKIGFAAQMANSQYYIGSLDMATENIEKIVAPVYNYGKGISTYGGKGVEIAQWSNDGKILLIRTAYNYGDDYGGNVWIVDTKNATEQNIFNDNGNENTISGGVVLDEYGNCKYIVVTKVHRYEAYNYSNNATLYDLSGKEIASISKSKTNSRQHLDSGYYNSQNNTITIYNGGFSGKSAIFDLNSEKWIKDWGTTSLDTWTGKISIFDNGIFSFNDGYNGGRYDNFYYMYSKKYLTSQDEMYLKALKRNSSIEDDTDNYVAFVDVDNTNLSGTNEFLEKEGVTSLSLKKTEPLGSLSDIIKSLLKTARYKLQLTGNKDNSATVKKNINLLPNTQYNYSFDTQMISGTSIDTFLVERAPDNYNATKYYKEVIYQEDFSDRYGGKREESGVSEFSCTLDKAGYISFIMQQTYHGRQIYLDGKLIDDSSNQSTDDLQFLILVPAGKHTITTNCVFSGVSYNTYVKCAEAGYITTEDNSFTQSLVNIKEGGQGTVSGSFFSPKDVLFYKNSTSYTATKINGNDLVNKGYMTYETRNGYGYITNNGNQLNVHSDRRVSNKGVLVADLEVTIKAPTDKKILIRSSRGIIKLNEGEQYSFNFSVQRYYAPTYSREFIVMSDIEAVEIPANNCPWYNDSNAIILGSMSALAAGNKVSTFSYGKDFYWIDTSTSTCEVYKCKIGDKKEFNTVIGFTNMYSTSALALLISNFKLEMLSNDRITKGEQFREKFASVNSLDKWQVYTKGSGRAQIVKYEPVKKEDDVSLVYKKGQLVNYGINYSDYENDPSKANQGYSYWVYAHEPFNDGENPQAAIIYDEDGNVVKICGKTVAEAASQAGISLEADGSISIENALEAAVKIGGYTLTESIPRFYVDGKYTVYHWEYDDTSRGTVSGGYPLYDKSSNMAELTFYIEGSASAPWITGISTSPAKVKENEYFSINIGMDDLEKDVLSLTTEVYKDKKKIFTHRQKNIYPLDSNGNKAVNGILENGTIASGEIKYPVINTGALPDKAQAGTYEVVCTVRDQTGAGLGQYKFVVVSEGKITGEVYHTEQWDINRKKYNVAKFGDEINKAYSYADYLKLKEPRKRGTNVFWSGEKFMLQAAVAGSPTKVTCEIKGTKYSMVMKSTGRQNAQDETIYEGSIWENSFINKWGSKKPEELVFVFTAYYSGGTSKTHECKVIVDNMDSYWKLHRVF